MTVSGIRLAQEIHRVPSCIVPLNAREEARFQCIVEEAVWYSWKP